MQKSKFSETQIVGILKDAESGMPVADLLRKHGVSKATFFKWRSKYGGASVSDVRQLREGAQSDLVVGHHEAEGARGLSVLLALRDPRPVQSLRRRLDGRGPRSSTLSRPVLTFGGGSAEILRKAQVKGRMIRLRGVHHRRGRRPRGWRITHLSRVPQSVEQSRLVILGAVARMSRCATSSSC